VRRDLDVIVIGGGVMGTAAARSLAERGNETVLFERATIGHEGGSSGGPTRIFRLAYHDPDYVRMAQRALEAWRDLESRADERLLQTTGGVDAGHASQVCADAMAAAGVAFERAHPEALTERWPALRFAASEFLIVQEDAGVCLVKETVRAQARLAREAGAVVVEHASATSIRGTPSGVEVVTTNGSAYRARVAVLAAGAWNTRLLHDVGIDVALRPTFEQPAHFALSAPSVLPTLVDRGGDPQTPRYAVPDPRDPRAVKIGTHLGRMDVDPDVLPSAPDPVRLASDIGYARERFDGVEPTGDVDTCIYTMTPDEDFVLDRRGDVVVCSPCSGHGFKFAPLIGAVAADLVEGRTPGLAIERFASTRASLRGSGTSPE
jgi:sarcosine oxidase